jgi:hypothetical protein
MEPYMWSFDEEFYFILNLAVGGNWPGNPLDIDGPDGDATVFPQAFEVDYVRVYEGIFPRIVGKTVVDCSEKNVAYEVVNVEEKEVSYTWTVPKYATIKEGQGTGRIIVNFDSTGVMENNILDSEVIHVQASGIDSDKISTSIGLEKLQENGIGIRVKVIDVDGACSNSSPLEAFNFDCGRPSTCTPYVLHRTTDDNITCGERIEWLMSEMNMEEKDACKEVSFKQFHGHCGPCNPLL